MPSRRRSALLRIGAPLCGSVLGLTVVRYAPPGVLAVRSLSLYLGFATLSLGSSFQTHPGSLRERMRAVAQKASRMLVTGVVLACACALFGARSFAALVDGQGGAPWRWALLQKPALVCAFPLYVVYAGRLATNLGSAPSRGFTARLHALEEVVSNVMLSALGAVIFWGGWQAPFAVTGESSKLLAAACFVAKVWAFGWLLACSRRLGWGERLRALPAAALCLLTLALTVAWIALAPPPEIELLIGQALAGSALVFALVTLVRTLPWLLPPPSAIRSAPVALRNGPSAPSEGSV